MMKLPEAIFVVDIGKENIAIQEARKLKIPIIGIVDTDCNPELVDYPIPGNDDSIKSVRFLLNEIVESYTSGANSFQEEVVEQLTAAEESIEEPTAEVEESPETSDATTTEEPTAEVEETPETSDTTTTEEPTAEVEEKPETSDATTTEKPEE